MKKDNRLTFDFKTIILIILLGVFLLLIFLPFILSNLRLILIIIGTIILIIILIIILFFVLKLVFIQFKKSFLEKKKNSSGLKKHFSLICLILVVFGVALISLITIWMIKQLGIVTIQMPDNGQVSRSDFDLFQVEDYELYAYRSATEQAKWDPKWKGEEQKRELVLWNWSEDELTELNILNKGFESSNYLMPKNWVIMGEGIYSGDNCYEGKKCIYVDLNKSPYSMFALNSKEVPVKELHNYTISMYVNCLVCNENSSYIAVIWLRDGSVKNMPGVLIERARHILYFHQTQGYEKFTVNLQAPPGSEAAILAVRAHVEKAYPANKTEFYIDG